MLSVETCRRILKENGYRQNLKDSDIADIRDFLTVLALIENNNESKDIDYDERD